MTFVTTFWVFGYSSSRCSCYSVDFITMATPLIILLDAPDMDMCSTSGQ